MTQYITRGPKTLTIGMVAGATGELGRRIDNRRLKERRESHRARVGPLKRLQRGLRRLAGRL